MSAVLQVKEMIGCLAVAAIAVSSGAGVVTARDEENGRYLVTVTDHEAGNVLSSAQVAELGSYELVKLGDGTLYAGDELKAFAGSIVVSNGYYTLTTTNALGTAAGETFVDGGTLINKLGNSVTNGSKPTFGQEKIHLKGTGCANNGALQNKSGNVDFCRNVVLDGDTTIQTPGYRLDLRSTTFDMNGHDLTVEGDRGEFLFVNLTMKNPGNITVNGGTFEFQSKFTGNCAGKTVTLQGGARLSLWDSPSWVSYNIVFSAGTKLITNMGTFKEYGTDNRNILNGTNTLEGPVALNIPNGKQIQLIGKVTGPGGFTGKSLGYLQILPQTGTTNDFQGGVAVSGTVTNGWPRGGVIVYSNRAIPSDGGALALTNAVLWNHSWDALSLPDVVADGCSMITSSYDNTSISTAKTLTKTGEETLNVNIPLKITGATEIKGGTLRFGQKIPEHPKGLNYTWNNTSEGSGIDESGVSYAYKGWPNVSGYDQSYSYTGYIRVPGTEGESVSCNWMTSIAREANVTIDGVVCCNFKDNKNLKDNITVGYARLAMYKPVTLKAGWRKISVYMSNWWDATRGPQANTGKGWVADFAIGVDWQARCVTNSAYYAKLLDPGDGSFLRASTNADDKAVYIKAENYRPSFGGSVAFAGGTTLDVNDYEPYVALTIPALVGLPTVTNGSVKVTSTTWTLRGSDLASGMPLTIAPNAVVQFGDANSEVTIAGDPAEWRSTLRAQHKTLSAKVKIVRDNGATAISNTFVLDPALAADGWTLSTDGRELSISRNIGLRLILK